MCEEDIKIAKLEKEIRGLKKEISLSTGKYWRDLRDKLRKRLADAQMELWVLKKEAEEVL